MSEQVRRIAGYGYRRPDLRWEHAARALRRALQTYMDTLPHTRPEEVRFALHLFEEVSQQQQATDAAEGGVRR